MKLINEIEDILEDKLAKVASKARDFILNINGVHDVIIVDTDVSRSHSQVWVDVYKKKSLGNKMARIVIHKDTTWDVKIETGDGKKIQDKLISAMQQARP